MDTSINCVCSNVPVVRVREVMANFGVRADAVSISFFFGQFLFLDEALSMILKNANYIFILFDGASLGQIQVFQIHIGTINGEKTFKILEV